MKLLEELLGFVVLTGPLFLIVLWLPLSFWVAAKLSKRFRGSKSRIPVGLVVFLVVFLLPFVDGIAGRLYFSYLCATEAGVEVHKTVKLPGDYWDAEGKPTFLEANGNYHLGEMYPFDYETGSYSSVFHVDNSGYRLLNAQSGEVLGKVTDFRYWGGWLRREFSPSNTATTCSGRAERFRGLITQIFKPS